MENVIKLMGIINEERLFSLFRKVALEQKKIKEWIFGIFCKNMPKTDDFLFGIWYYFLYIKFLSIMRVNEKNNG